jgi:hypothetical protein
MARSINRRIAVQTSMSKKQDPFSKITRVKRGWRHGSSSRVPPLRKQSPEFKPQYYQKNKRY